MSKGLRDVSHGSIHQIPLKKSRNNIGKYTQRDGNNIYVIFYSCLRSKSSFVRSFVDDLNLRDIITQERTWGASCRPLSVGPFERIGRHWMPEQDRRQFLIHSYKDEHVTTTSSGALFCSGNATTTHHHHCRFAGSTTTVASVFALVSKRYFFLCITYIHS